MAYAWTYISCSENVCLPKYQLYVFNSQLGHKYTVQGPLKDFWLGSHIWLCAFQARAVAVSRVLYVSAVSTAPPRLLILIWRDNMLHWMAKSVSDLEQKYGLDMNKYLVSGIYRFAKHGWAWILIRYPNPHTSSSSLSWIMVSLLIST